MSPVPHQPSHVSVTARDHFPHGATDVELLAAVLGPSSRRWPLTVADRVVRSVGLVGLCRVRVDDLAACEGMGPERASRLLAGIELGRRAHELGAHGPTCDAPEAIFELCRDLVAEEQEHVCALLLSARHRCLRRVTISVGSLTASIVHPREVFAPALRYRAANLIVVHNHPSGDPAPSADDVVVTRRLVRAGHLLGVPVLDHVIVARGGYASLRREGRGIAWEALAEDDPFAGETPPPETR